ncbi:MFS transporter [Paenibacillus qinlingensis]|nr:MFS transporter [Paenibacillus qinlingensis]
MNEKMVLPVWTIGLFIVVMNTTMFNVSIPSIIHDLHISADQGSWVISSYSLGYALSTIIYSRLTDVVPMRKLLTVGLLVLGLSSLLGFFANDFYTLLMARIIQSMGSGTMAGLGLVLVSRYIPKERRGSAIAMISAGSAMAFGLGPIIGGLVNAYFGWNGLFAVTCLVLVILPALLSLLPRENALRFHFDIPGASLTVVNAVTLLLTVTQVSVIWLAVFCLSIVLHTWHMSRGKETFINPDLFRSKAYRKLIVIGFCILMLNLGNLFLMPLVLAKVFNLSAMKIGVTIAPGAILSAFLTRYFGRWIDRYGNLLFLFIGHTVMVFVLLLFCTVLGASPIVILIGYICFSPAFSATLASLNNETSRILMKAHIGSGMGLMQLIQFCGGSISVAVCGVLLETHKKTEILASYQHLYGLMLLIGLLSIGILIWFKLSINKESDSLKTPMQSEGV